MPRKFKVVLGYKHEGMPREFVAYVEGRSQEDAFYRARKELRMKLVEEAFQASENCHAVSYEQI